VLPVDLRGSPFDARFKAWLVALTERFRAGRREAVQLAHETFGVRLSVGTMSNIEKQASEVIAAAVTEAIRHVQKQDVMHMDETSYRQQGKRTWM